MPSDASALSQWPPAHCSCHQPESPPSRSPHQTPLFIMDHHCWDSVSIFPASSPLQGWKPSHPWRGAAKTVSLLDGGAVCLCSAKQIRDTSRGKAKALEYCGDCFVTVDVYYNCENKLFCWRVFRALSLPFCFSSEQQLPQISYHSTVPILFSLKSYLAILCVAFVQFQQLLKIRFNYFFYFLFF